MISRNFLAVLTGHQKIHHKAEPLLYPVTVADVNEVYRHDIESIGTTRPWKNDAILDNDKQKKIILPEEVP